MKVDRAIKGRLTETAATIAVVLAVILQWSTMYLMMK